ncbi:MAG: hypothetical protein ACXAD7_18815 [Candidatus Kariarchaeaceae archaeon]|jgi:hypothetical protein
MPSEVDLPLKNNYIISDKMFLTILRRLIESENYPYTTDIEYSSPIDDSMVFKICNGTNKLTITRLGSNDDRITIHGEYDYIKQFLHDLAIEATTIVFSELCANAFMCSDSKLENTIHGKLKNMMDSVFQDESLLRSKV